MYTAIYLPIQQDKIEEGDIVINKQGEHFEFSEKLGWNLESIKPAILCLVEEVYNERLIVGVPMPADGWIKPGTTVKESSCSPVKGMAEAVLFLGESSTRLVPVIAVKCPVCERHHQ